jgi:hypothetical protein
VGRHRLRRRRTYRGLDQEYETRFRAILDGPVEYTLDGDRLTITSPTGRGVVFTADGDG